MEGGYFSFGCMVEEFRVIYSCEHLCEDLGRMGTGSRTSLFGAVFKFLCSVETFRLGLDMIMGTCYFQCNFVPGAVPQEWFTTIANENLHSSVCESARAFRAQFHSSRKCTVISEITIVK